MSNIPFSKYLEAFAEAARKLEEEFELESQAKANESEPQFEKQILLKEFVFREGTNEHTILNLFFKEKCELTYGEIIHKTGIKRNSVTGTILRLNKDGWIYRTNYRTNPAKYKLRSGLFWNLDHRTLTIQVQEYYKQLLNEMTGKLSGLMLGEKIPLEICNSETGEVIIPVNKEITKTLLKKLADNYKCLSMVPSPIRDRINEIIEPYKKKLEKLEN